jgi:glycerophosphoryl diester phosphodiesterase
MSNKRHLTVVGHRGDMENALENTRQSILAGISSGADCIEVDAQLSLDHELFIMHDDTIDRTTTSTGILAQKTAKELDSVRMKNGELGVPRLSEAIDIVVLKKKRRLVIDIKLERNLKRQKILLNKIDEMISEKKVGESVIISSFEIEYLSRFAEKGIMCFATFLDTQYHKKRSLLEIFSLLFSDKKIAGYIKKAKHHGAGSLSLPVTLINKRRIKLIHQAGIKACSYYNPIFRFMQLFRYKKNDYRLIRLNLDGMISNAPRKTMAARRELLGR